MNLLTRRFGSRDRIQLPSYLVCIEIEHDVIWRQELENANTRVRGGSTILKLLLSRLGSTDGIQLPPYLTCFEFEHDVL